MENIKVTAKRSPKKRPSQGLGDTIAKVTKATGIEKLVKFIAGEDCGCNERKEKLNKLFPYVKPECLQEDEYQYLVWWFSETRNQIKPSEQRELIKYTIGYLTRNSNLQAAVVVYVI